MKWVHLASSAIFTWPSPIDYHFFKHLINVVQGKHLHNQQEAENVLPTFTKSRSMDFYTTEINLFLTGKKCVDSNGSYFDLKKMCLSLIIMI